MYPGYIQALRTPETPWEPSKQAEGTPNNTCSIPQSLTQGDPESQPAQNHKRTLLALTHILGSLVPPHALWGTPWYHPTVHLCLQVPPADNEGLTYTELQAVTPSFCLPGPSAVSQPPVICLRCLPRMTFPSCCAPSLAIVCHRCPYPKGWCHG